MNKIRLGTDDLRVESFPVAADEAGGGTVRGQWWTHAEYPCYTDIEGGFTCEPFEYTCPECASPPETRYACDPPIDP